MIRNKLKYLIFLSAVGVLSVLYNEYMMGILFLTIIVIPFALFAILFYTSKKISGTLSTVMHVANKGELLPVSVMLYNPTIFPVSNLTIYVTYKNSFSVKSYKKELAVNIDRRTKSNVICNLQSDCAGNLEITLNGIRNYDFIKLFSLKKKMNQKITIAVLPDLYELAQQDIRFQDTTLSDSEYFSQSKSGDDPSEVFAIREYREGDKPQRIHWKLSRKYDQIMIKEFSKPVDCSFLIFLHLTALKTRDSLRTIDSLIEAAFSLSHTLQLKGQMHYMAWYERENNCCQRIQIAQEKDMFEALDGVMQSHPCNNGTDVIAAYLAQFPRECYTDVILFTDEAGYRQLDCVDQLAAGRKQLILVQNTMSAYEDEEDKILREIPKEIRERSAELGIKLFCVGTGNVKEDMLEFEL